MANSWKPLTIWKKCHLRCPTGFWTHLWYIYTCIDKNTLVSVKKCFIWFKMFSRSCVLQLIHNGHDHRLRAIYARVWLCCSFFCIEKPEDRSDSKIIQLSKYTIESNIFFIVVTNTILNAFITMEDLISIHFWGAYPLFMIHDAQALNERDYQWLFFALLIYPEKLLYLRRYHMIFCKLFEFDLRKTCSFEIFLYIRIFGEYLS